MLATRARLAGYTLEDIPPSLGCPSEHGSPSNRIDPVGASRAISDAKQELLLGHSVSSSERSFLDTSVNHFIFLCINAGYSVTLNPNRQPAYIVERWLIRFQSARLVLYRRLS